MGSIKQIEIKNRTYYFFHDMINIKDVDSSLIKIGKSPTKILVSIILVTSQWKEVMIMKILIVQIHYI